MAEFILTLIFVLILLITCIILTAKSYIGKKTNPLANLFFGGFTVFFSSINYIGNLEGAGHGGKTALIFNAIIFAPGATMGLVLLIYTIIKQWKKQP